MRAPIAEGDIAAEDSHMREIAQATEREIELGQEQPRPWASHGDGSAQENADRAADLEAAPKAKRRKGKSPTSRTLEELRKRGWTAQVVEQPWNKFSKVTLDLFGVIDLVAIVPPEYVDSVDARQTRRGAILGIQATGGKDGGMHAARRTKILAEPRAAEWVAAGGRLELWSWSKRGAAGKAKRWTLRVETYAEMVSAASEGA